jgi:hypothetical protein
MRAPASFTTRNAVADVCRIADSPSAAAIVWTTHPNDTPSPDATPIRRPCAMLLPMMKNVSCPGVRLSTIPVTTNSQ